MCYKTPKQIFFSEFTSLFLRGAGHFTAELQEQYMSMMSLIFIYLLNVI